MKRGMRVFTVLAFAASFVAGPALAAAASGRQDCCPTTCPLPEDGTPACCDLDPAAPPSEIVFGSPAQPVHVPAAAASVEPPPDFTPVAAVGSPGPPGRLCEASSGLSPPAPPTA